MQSYKERLININVFVFDVDGVLTNGMTLLHPNGEYLREIYARDMQGFKLAKENGFKLCAITAGRSQTVKNALLNLGFDEVHLGAHDKLSVFENYITRNSFQKKEVLYMGDDIADIPVLKEVGISTCPQDAVQDVRSICDYVSHYKGGNGCAREVIEQTLRMQNKWLY